MRATSAAALASAALAALAAAALALLPEDERVRPQQPQGAGELWCALLTDMSIRSLSTACIPPNSPPQRAPTPGHVSRPRGPPTATAGTLSEKQKEPAIPVNPHRVNAQIRLACGLPARQVMLVYRSGQKYGGHRASSSTTHTRYDSTVLVWHHQHLCDARELGEARPVRACPTGRHHASAVALHAAAVRAVGGVGVGGDISER